MAKKKKSTKKRAVSVRGEKLYEAFSSKIEASKYAKKIADKDAKFHTPLVARVLMSFDKPVSLERVITAAKNSGYESDNVERCVRGDLAILVREGLAKATKAEMNGAAPKKQKRARKPRSVKRPTAEAIDRSNELEATA